MYNHSGLSPAIFRRDLLFLSGHSPPPILSHSSAASTRWCLERLFGSRRKTTPNRLKLSRQKISLNINWEKSIYHFYALPFVRQPVFNSRKLLDLWFPLQNPVLSFPISPFLGLVSYFKKSLAFEFLLLLNLFLSNVPSTFDRFDFERSVRPVVWIILKNQNFRFTLPRCLPWWARSCEPERFISCWLTLQNSVKKF